MDTCAECGMPLGAIGEYHPYAACLMFKACRNSNVVWENLYEVLDYGMKAEAQGVDADQAMHDIRKVRV